MIDQKYLKERRCGDLVAIDGDYQWRAANSKNAIQNFWHYTKKTAINFLCPPSDGSNILDVGCGSGVLTDFLSKKYRCKVTGIDGNRYAIDFAKSQFPEANFLCANVDDVYGENGTVDYIFCLELIEHIYEPQVEVLLDNFYRLLRPGGKIFVTTPNYRSLWPIIEKAMDMLKVAPKLASDQHVQKYTLSKLSRQIQAKGFILRDLKTNCFLAPWVAFFSRGLAEDLDRIEVESGIRFGSIIVAVAEKPILGDS